MLVVRDTASIVVRLLLAMILFAGPVALAPASADGATLRAEHAAGHMDAQDCCVPEPASLDPDCVVACAQAPCGWTIAPVEVACPTTSARHAAFWPAAVTFLAGIAHGPATPPPRA